MTVGALRILGVLRVGKDDLLAEYRKEGTVGDALHVEASKPSFGRAIGVQLLVANPADRG